MCPFENETAVTRDLSRPRDKEKAGAQGLGKKTLLTSGLLLALCASAGYILLSDEKKLAWVEEILADGLGFQEDPCC